MKVKNVTVIRLSCCTRIKTPLITSSSCGLHPTGAALGAHLQELPELQSAPGVDEPSGSCCKEQEPPPAP